MNSKFFKNIGYAIYPRRCNICGEVVDINQPICDDCKSIKRVDGELCYQCGKLKKDCDCKKAHHKPKYDKIVAPFYYDDKIVIAVHKLKFNDDRTIAYTMAEHIANKIKAEYSDISFDYITDVPLYPIRSFIRGYNQSTLLAKEISKLLNIPYQSTLKKLFNNTPQRTLSAKQRRGNVYGVYDIKDDIDVEDKTILIIDDVKTTGATISECASVLKMYGAKSVCAATFAIR